MPAKSRSQQRLFGMVHAYNKGELHCSPELRRRVARIAGGISDEDARHFAETPHKGLPEKRSSAPSDSDLRRMYEVLQADARLFRRLRALGLVDSVRAGRRIRNRIVHQPGYVPSGADLDRALRDYAAAERVAGRSEKRAQVAIRPDAVLEMYDKIPVRSGVEELARRSSRRRSLLSMVATGAAVGAVAGGVGAGALGRYLSAYGAANSRLPPADLRGRTAEAIVRCGLWGAGRGAMAGAILGGGFGLLGKLRS